MSSGNSGTAICHHCHKRHPWAWWPNDKAELGYSRAFDNHYGPSDYDPLTGEGEYYPMCDGSLAEVTDLDVFQPRPLAKPIYQDDSEPLGDAAYDRYGDYDETATR